MFLFGLKIVTLLPSLTEIVLYFSTQNLIGVSKFDKVNLPKFLGYEYEKIISLKPDEVWLDVSQKDLIENYKKLNIKYRTFNTTRLRNLNELNQEIKEISILLNSKEKGSELIRELEASFFDAGKQKKALWIISLEPVVLFGRDSIFADILKRFGFDVSLHPKGLSGIMPLEKFLKMPFDVLFVPSNEVKKLEKYIKDKKIYALDVDKSMRANHNLIFHLRDVLKN
ncbi:MAG: ABC transporter substrate-binding protein [bacterium]|nr:ABC transporter substrate-binding protein [bacterium]